MLSAELVWGAVLACTQVGHRQKNTDIGFGLVAKNYIG